MPIKRVGPNKRVGWIFIKYSCPSPKLPTWTVSAFYVVAAVVSSVIVFSSLVAESPLISRISEGLHGKLK